MTPKIESGSLTTDATSSSQSGVIAPKRHFDTFETQFFQQGESESAGVAGEVEHFDDFYESARRRRFLPSRQFMMGVAVGSTVIAIIGCIALWRSSNANARAAAAVAIAPPAQAEPVAATPAAVAPAAPAAQAEPAPANPAAMPAQAEPVPAPAPAQPAPAVAEAVPSQAPTPAPAAPAAAPAPAQPTPAAVAPAVAAQAEPVPVVAEKPAAAEPVPAKPEVAAAEKPAAPAVASSTSDAQGRCKKAISDKRNKEVLATCPDAFAADPSAAGIAVALAKIEFDRGKSVQAANWGQKAIAADPDTADAYVFIGGAEQNAGHRKAAKEAYKRYLQLAPGGRYAADLRAIVGSL
jgi:tetratricopeptide (TPR) repeat protein